MRRLMLLLTLLVPVTASAGPLDLEQGFKYLYKQAAERGVVATLINHRGDKTVAVALHVLVSKKQRVFAISLGAERTMGNGDVYRGLIATPVNMAELGRMAMKWKPIGSNFDIMVLPDDWDLWVGPYCRIPPERLKEWRWRSHTGLYASLGKKF